MLCLFPLNRKADGRVPSASSSGTCKNPPTCCSETAASHWGEASAHAAISSFLFQRGSSTIAPLNAPMRTLRAPSYVSGCCRNQPEARRLCATEDLTFQISFRLSNALYYLFFAHIFWRSTTSCSPRSSWRTITEPAAGRRIQADTQRPSGELRQKLVFDFCHTWRPPVLAVPRWEEKESKPQPWCCQANVCTFSRKLFS